MRKSYTHYAIIFVLLAYLLTFFGAMYQEKKLKAEIEYWKRYSIKLESQLNKQDSLQENKDIQTTIHYGRIQKN